MLQMSKDNKIWWDWWTILSEIIGCGARKCKWDILLNSSRNQIVSGDFWFIYKKGAIEARGIKVENM